MNKSVRIHPSILNADHSNILSEIDRVSKVSDLLHLDILDGKFAPNTSFSWEQAQYIISGSAIPVDAHLMVADVDRIAAHLDRQRHLADHVAGMRADNAATEDAVGTIKPACTDPTGATRRVMRHRA